MRPLSVGVMVLTALCVALGPATNSCFAQPTASQAAGLTLRALSKEDLDAIEQKIGHRVGILITAVAPGSPAAAIGLRANDLLFLVGQSPVASPEAVEQALAGRTGTIKIGGARFGADGKGEVIETQITLPGPDVAPAAGGASAPDLSAKLKALDAALAAGVITQDEYNRKRAEMAAAAGPDPETRSKLEALQAARASGVLSEAEYQQKRAALTGAGAPAPPAGAAPAGAATYSDPQGRFFLRYPASLQAKAREDNAGVDLLRGQATGSVMAFKGEGTARELLDAFHGPVRQQTKQYREVRTGEVAVGAGKGLMVEYTGIDPNGLPCHASLTAAAGEGYGYLFMLVAPEADFGAVQADWAAVLQGFSRQAPAAALPAPAGGTGGGGATPLPSPSADPLTAYLDMLDFMRAEGFGRPVTTPPADRQRLAALLQQADAQTKQNVTQGLQPVPGIWAGLQEKWKAAGEDKRAEQRRYWAAQLLSPTFVYPPPLDTETFKGRNDRVTFEYPKGWVVAQTEAEGNQYLYLGPSGTQTSWDRVLDRALSPPGALLVIMPLPAELKGVKHVEGARLAAREYVTTAGAEFSEICAVDLGEGAIIALRGRYPGQAEERFCWVGVVKYGADSVLAGRLSGPVSEALTLVPAFSHLVMTMELKPPEGADGGYGGAMVDYYTSRLGNTVAGAAWH